MTTAHLGLEQNSLFMHVLAAFGYRVEPLAGRVRFGSPHEAMAPRTHCFLRSSCRIEFPPGTRFDCPALDW